jgi:transcription initiation factor TFIIIB Brf1 subunit/transcription initiation factor TFIIB
VPKIYKAGKDLSKLEGEELTEAIKEEMKLRKKELNKDIAFQDVINFRIPELVGEYVGKCIEWMKHQEEEFKMPSNYIDNPNQKKSPQRKKSKPYKLTRQDRAVAVDLVVEIHRKYGLVPETLFVAISAMDRYLATRKDGLKRAKDIEAVGVASLLIASKYEDIYPPALDEMIGMMGRPSTRKEVLEWEFKILKELVFQITVPTPFRFLERFAATSVVYQNASQLAQYIIELALYDFDIQYNLAPSEIAAVALFIAVNFDFYGNKISPKLKWSSEVAKESSVKKGKILEFFNTYFVDLAFRVEREYKVNDINVKYPQYQFVDDEPLGLFNPFK